MRFFFYFCFTLFSVSTIFAQAQFSPVDMALPVSEKAPEWAEGLLNKNPNVFQIDMAYEAYFKNHAYKKTAWVKYYRHWRRRVTPYIQADGFLLSQDKIEDFRKNIEKKPSPLKENATWTNIGPNITRWLSQDNSTGDPCPWQANIYTFEVAPSDPNKIYLITETGSFFKTNNKGKTWQIAGGNYLLSSEALAIHPIDANTVILGTDGVVRRSTDAGTTWTNIYSNAGLWCYKIVYKADDPNIILMATNKGLIRSTNGGTSWQIIDTNDCRDIELNPSNANIVYILKQNTSSNFYECWKSTNAGQNFTAKTLGWPTGLTNGVGRLAVSKANANRIYAVLLTDNEPRIMKSNDAGESWTAVAKGSSTALEMNNGQGYYDLDILVSSQNADQLIVATTTAFRSDDGGVNYTAIGGYFGTFSIHPDIQAMRNNGTDTYIATDGGFSYSNDFFTNTSEPRSQGIYATDLWGFDSGWNEDVLVGGRYHNGNTAYYQSYPQGEFLRMGGGEAATGYVNPIKNRQTFFSDIGAYEIPDKINGKVSNLPVSKWPNESYYSMEYSEMAWDPRCWNTVYIGNGPSVWKSTNNGVSYDSIFTSTDQGAEIEHIEICRSNPDVIYATQRSNPLGDGKIWKTTNGGKTWNALPDLPVTGGQRRVMTISASGDSENELWVALAYSANGKKVYYTPNGGNTWVNWTSSKLDGFNLTDLMHQLGTNGGVYVAGGNGKLFYRNKSMADWDDFSAGLPVNHSSRAMKAFYRDNKLRSGSNVGFWETPLYESSHLLAQPCVDKLSSACSRDTFYFDDYSVFQYDGQQKWSWDFPGALSVVGANTRTPKVVYGISGSYNVSLTISNSQGTITKTIQNMIKVLPSECRVDTIAGKCLEMIGNNKIISIPSIPRLKDAESITVMAWIKLNDQQQYFTQLVSNWSSNASFGFGFAFQGYVPTVNLTFSWQNVPYWQTSPFNLEINKWIHVAMTVEPTKVTLYKDGIPWVYNGDFSNFDLSSTPFEIGGPVYGQGGTFNGEMDEFKIFKKALSQNEVREQMHLIDKNLSDDLVLYYQFNEQDPSLVYDKTGQSHGQNGSGQLSVSSAAIATGVSDRISINNIGKTLFPKSGVEFNFPAGGGTNLPNGEMVVSRLYAQPFGAPSVAKDLSSHYWVVENWGSNLNFSGLSEIGFYNSGIKASSSKLYQRPVYGVGAASWNSKSVNGTQINGGLESDINFTNNNLVSGASQLILSGDKTLVLANAGLDQTICKGDTAQLVGSGGISYEWFDKNGFSIGNTKTISISPTTNTQFILQVKDVNGNQGTDTVLVNILPPPIANAGNDMSFCQGDSLQLGASGGLKYLWSPANSLSNKDVKNPVSHALTNTNYFVTVTDGNGCRAIDSVFITVNELPDVIVNDVILTAGQAAKTSISGNYVIKWSNGTTDSTFNTALTGQYSVTVTNANNCTKIISFNVVLDSNSLPNIYLQQPALLGLQQIANSDAYQWYLDNQLIGGATAATIVPPGNGLYTTYVHYANGFEATTPAFLYNKTAVINQNEVKISYFPNPAKNIIQFVIENPNSVDLSNLTCHIYQMNGTTVLNNILHVDKKVDISGLAAGNYYFILSNNKINFKGKIQVVK